MERRAELIAEMTPAIWIHLIAALIALGLGAFVLWQRKGTARHKLLGRVWVGVMLVVAISSFFIREIREDGFSPIHLLSIYTLVTLTLGINAIRARPSRIQKHRREMQTLYASALLIAGGFTFLPFRLLGRLTFGETVPLINYVIVAVMAGTGLYLFWHAYRRNSVSA